MCGTQPHTIGVPRAARAAPPGSCVRVIVAPRRRGSRGDHVLRSRVGCRVCTACSGVGGKYVSTRLSCTLREYKAGAGANKTDPYYKWCTWSRGRNRLGTGRDRLECARLPPAPRGRRALADPDPSQAQESDAATHSLDVLSLNTSQVHRRAAGVEKRSRPSRARGFTRGSRRAAAGGGGRRRTFA